MPGVPFIAAAALTALGGLVWCGYELRGDSGGGRPRCRGCGYDMSAVGGLKCPECGRAHKSETQTRYSKRSRPRLAGAAVVTLIAAAGVVSPWYSNTNPWSVTPTRMLIALWPIAEKLEWSSAIRIETQLLQRTLTASEARALCGHLIAILNDTNFNGSDNVAEMVLLGLAEHEDGQITFENDREPQPAILSDSDEDHYFVKLGDAGADLVPGLVKAARRLSRTSSAPTTLLSLLSARCPRACDGLISLLNDNVGSAEALALRGGDLGVDRVLSAIESGSLGKTEFVAALGVLQNMEVHNPRAAPVLLSALLEKTGPDEYAAMSDLLARIGVDRELVLPARDAIIKAALREDAREPRGMFGALAGLVGNLKAEDLAPAAPSLEARNAATRARAAALFVLTSDAPDMSDVLAGALAEGTDAARAIVYDAARVSRSRDPRIVAGARRDGGAVEGACAQSAREYLGTALERKELAAFWAALLDHEDWRVRELACDSLGGLGEQDAPTLARLQTLESDAEPWVAKAASRALRSVTRTRAQTIEEQITDEIEYAQRRGGQLSAVFMKYLGHRDPHVRDAAVAQLGVMLGDDRRIDELISMSGQLPGEASSALVVRLVELGAFARAADMIAVLASQTWQSDRSFAVSAAISRLTPEQAMALRDPLVKRLRRAVNTERNAEIIGAVEAMAAPSR